MGDSGFKTPVVAHDLWFDLPSGLCGTFGGVRRMGSEGQCIPTRRSNQENACHTFLLLIAALRLQWQ